jgi:glutamyl-tRNA reductase
MYILVAGVRHQTAPIEVRERFALTEEQIETAIPMLMSLPSIRECAILTTCNRTELYVVVNQTDEGLQSIKTFFAEFKQVDYDAYRGSVFTLLHEDAAMHLFRVASGLDSLILGEGQILAQVKETLAVAQRHKSNGVVLDKLFKTALSIGKRVRTETGISNRDISVSRAAYEYARQLLPDFLDKRITMVGGGKMAEILLHSLRREMTDAQRERVCVVNRSANRLATLTEKFGFRGVTWEQLEPVIAESDVLFVATGAPHVVLDTEDFPESSPKLVIDISVPRNVAPEVGELPWIQLFNTDNLAGITGYSPEMRDQLKDQARAIIYEEYANFFQWLISLPVVGPTITMLRSKVETIRKSEASCSCPVTGTSCSVIDNLSKNLVNKILHDPTVRLKATRNMEEIYQQAAMLSHLFNFEASSESASQLVMESQGV